MDCSRTGGLYFTSRVPSHAVREAKAFAKRFYGAKGVGVALTNDISV